MRRDVIAIEGLVVDCVVGVYPHERDTLQPLRVDLYLELDTRSAGARERLRESVNYAAIAAQLEFLLGACRFHMLETAAHALSRYLLLPPALGERRAQIEALRLKLTKPSALGGRAVPYLEIQREAGEVRANTEEAKFGNVDIVHQTEEAGIYRLNIAPGKSIPLHVHREMRESELVLSEGLLCQGEAIAEGSVFHWPLGAAHRYDNPTQRYQSILCVDAPRFMPHDEIEVTGEPVDLSVARVARGAAFGT
jgi:dihydroneopterin aldolase